MKVEPPPEGYRTWGRGRGRVLRLPRYPAGLPVHVTMGTHERKRVFEQKAFADMVLEELRLDCRTVVGVVMPDHVHWLLADGDDLLPVAGRFKSVTTRRAWDLGHRGKLWQRSFHDTVIRNREGLQVIAEYILGNPVRSGLVTEAAEYRWSVLYPDRVPE